VLRRVPSRCALAQTRQLTKSENRLDFGVDRDVRGGDAIDGILFASGLGEIEEAADVVVLVVTGEEALGFGGSQREGGERYGLAKIAS
jgi:hypothetical protein